MLLVINKTRFLKAILQVICAGIILSLSGCTRTKEMVAVVLKDRGEEYTCAEAYPSLKIPKGMPRDNSTDTYRIPECSPQ